MSDGTTLVLTSRELDSWLSLQEIVRAIERVWTAIGRSGRGRVEMVRSPLGPELDQRLLRSASTVERVVLVARTPDTNRLALDLRRRMGVEVPMIVYVHGDALEGFGPFDELRNALTARDVLVVSCEAEARTTRCCFPDAQVRVVPFPLVDRFTIAPGGRDTSPPPTLAYVGRLSEQKNLHTLLVALWVLQVTSGEAPSSLDVYGAEDDLGTPHSGLHFPGYGAYLRRLADSLGLHDVVRWHGFMPRDWLFDNVHTRPHVFVSPTLHSDENFGSAVLASLVNGHRVVTTAWGGHLGFQVWFPDQLALVPVLRSTRGPVVDPVRLAAAIARATGAASTPAPDERALVRARAAFSERSVTARTLALVDEPLAPAVALERSPAQRYIDDRRDVAGVRATIYSGYADPVLQTFHEAYGMTRPIVFDPGSPHVLPPWVSCSATTVTVDDPHRGRQTISLGADDGRLLDVRSCPTMDVQRLPERVVETLVGQGYAFVLPGEG